MGAIFRFLCLFLLFFSVQTHYAQEKIGLVLSGGGATGLAHIGVLKALEERGIPIDYIAGTSAGALVGAMYACGYSPEEIEAYALSDAFRKMSSGELEANQRFAYREPQPSASMFSLPFSKDSILNKSLPTNFTSSTYLDFEMMRIFEPAVASVNYDFDQLFVPFRCVASDITNKRQVVFSEGHLNQAIRSSMSFPFYLRPLVVNNVILFDGGLYNNFPANIMYYGFDPDFIIGSNVSYNAAPPTQDDLISQITNMLVYYSDFTLPCDEGVIIEPKTNVTTFAFGSAEQAIEDGYFAAQSYLDSIEKQITRRVTKEELQVRRKEFRSKIMPVEISSIRIKHSQRKESEFIRKSMLRVKKNEILTGKQLERRYFRLNASETIDFIYPTLTLLPDSTFQLNLDAKKAKDFKLEIGGHFSSRSVNTGYLGLSYLHLGKFATTVSANSYFGKFYGSVKTAFSLDAPSVFPFTISTYFVMNRWDYFKSRTTFFEDVKPSFLLQNEIYVGAGLKHAIGNNSTGIFDGRFFFLEDDYYQTTNFSSTDTVDFTKFQGASFSWSVEQNTLNRKQFASSGHHAAFKAKFVYGNERSESGSTAPIPYAVERTHSWINLRANFQSFPLDFKRIHIGIHGNATLNSQSLFANYTASILAMTAFEPLPDMGTFFLPEYRSPQYFGVGSSAIVTPLKNTDLRVDAFYYQPLLQIELEEDGTFGYSKPFAGSSWLASASIIYHSFFGPVRLTANYFPQQSNPLYVQFSFGYVLFNERAIR